MDKKSKTFFITLLALLLLSAAVSYYRLVVLERFAIFTQASDIPGVN